MEGRWVTLPLLPGVTQDYKTLMGIGLAISYSSWLISQIINRLTKSELSTVGYFQIESPILKITDCVRKTKY